MRRQVLAPYSHFDIPVIGQAYLLFRARLMAPHTHAPGVESLETALFLPEDIPFDQVSHAAKLFLAGPASACLMGSLTHPTQMR